MTSYIPLVGFAGDNTPFMSGLDAGLKAESASEHDMEFEANRELGSQLVLAGLDRIAWRYR